MSPPSSLRAFSVLALISFCVFLGALDLTVVSTTLRQIIFDLEIPFPQGLNQAAWIVTGYLLAYTITMPFMGRLSDLFGRRRVYILCLGLFLLGSGIVSVASSLLMMIAGRMIQALGAGALVPVSMAVVGDVFPPEKRAIALGVIGAVDTAGWVLGPLYGAAMVSQFSWRWIFIINLPLGIFALLAACLALGYSKRAAEGARLDYPGAIFLSVALAALSLALTGSSADEQSAFTAATASSGGGFSPYAPAWLALFLIAAVAFYVREKRAANPLIDLGIFRSGAIRAACLVNLCVGGALIAGIVDVPLFVNTVMLLARGTTPAQADWQSGIILAALTSAMVVASILGGFLTGALGYRATAIFGLTLAGAGYILLSQWGPGVEQGVQVRDLIVCGLGLGVVISPVATIVINTVDADARGTAAALILILRLVGMTLVLSALTTWGVNRYQTLARDIALTELTVQVVMQISARVLDEIFAWAAAICLIAIAPALFLRRPAKDARPVRGWI